MYTSFYKLDSKPFDIAPDPAFLWLGEKQTHDFTTLRYTILENKGFLLLTGAAGTGKTTLIHGLIESLEEDTHCAVIDDPRLERIDFYNAIAKGFGVDKKFTSKVQFLIQFSHFLHKADDENIRVVLLVDDCHLLSQEMLEELRLLSNIEKADKKLINIFFVGRTEFKDVLGLQKNRAVNQRLTEIIELQPLKPSETEDYIRYRLRIAGTEEKLFTARAIQTIHRFSQGIPSQINLICNHSLTLGAEQARKTIDNKFIEQAVQGMDSSVYRVHEPSEMEPEEDLIYNPFKGKLLTGRGPVPESYSGFNLEKDHQRNWLKYGFGLLLLCAVLVYFQFPLSQSLESGQTVVVETAKEPESKVVPQVSASPAVTMLEESKIEMSETKAAELKTAILAKAYGDGEPQQHSADVVSVTTSAGVALTTKMEKDDEAAGVVASGGSELESGVEQQVLSLKEQIEKETAPVKNFVSEGIPVEVTNIPDIASTPELLPEKHNENATKQTAPLEPKKVIVRLRPNSLKLTRSGQKELDDFVAKLKLYPRATVFVKGYVSAKTNSRENIKLSEDRAKIVRKMMLDEGIDPEQIEIIGMGNQEPIASNSTREGRRLNRRVEIVVINDGL